MTTPHDDHPDRELRAAARAVLEAAFEWQSDRDAPGGAPWAFCRALDRLERALGSPNDGLRAAARAVLDEGLTWAREVQGRVPDEPWRFAVALERLERAAP
jgi:hypothetical protein